MDTKILVVNQQIAGEEVQMISARELYEFLEVKSRFNDWINNRIAEYAFIGNQDFVTFTKTLVKGRPATEYHITLAMAKELAMVERNEKGREARLYFIECERRLKQSQTPMIPQTLPEALRLAAAEAEKRMALESQLAVVAPKAMALDLISKADGDLCITDAAKTLDTQPRKLFDWLSQNAWIYKRGGKGEWIAYQDKIQSGLLRHSQHTHYSERMGMDRLTTQVLVTPKGLAFLAKQISTQEVA
ncbi:phage antirepressor KilAC domain-containing protein [Vitreoscilla stercoraria]|uniref:Phage antirepressor KilAC domain-containing protein n=1 Tax=Vitreoscilla stercoraria TaxID=61 RepID=A0ABY4EC96_VITST|nr:phage antirepressor KilAC domain-containing protein [Vitreoscilla stercoraria]UOO93369.1 phage antirepressor KilAC domain-containing protein [Vitreoscilla stercoraria]